MTYNPAMLNEAQITRLIYLRKLSELRRLVDAHKPTSDKKEGTK